MCKWGSSNQLKALLKRRQTPPLPPPPPCPNQEGILLAGFGLKLKPFPWFSVWWPIYPDDFGLIKPPQSCEPTL